MKTHVASLINALFLIVLPLWGYLSLEDPSATRLIPAVVGILLLLCNKGLKKENKAVAHIAVLLTLLIAFGLIKPLTSVIKRGDIFAIIRVVLMLVSTVFALYFFVRSFINARKNRTEKP